MKALKEGPMRSSSSSSSSEAESKRKDWFSQSTSSSRRTSMTKGDSTSNLLNAVATKLKSEVQPSTEILKRDEAPRGRSPSASSVFKKLKRSSSWSSSSTDTEDKKQKESNSSIGQAAARCCAYFKSTGDSGHERYKELQQKLTDARVGYFTWNDYYFKNKLNDFSFRKRNSSSSSSSSSINTSPRNINELPTMRLNWNSMKLKKLAVKSIAHWNIHWIEKAANCFIFRFHYI